MALVKFMGTKINKTKSNVGAIMSYTFSSGLNIQILVVHILSIPNTNV
jgi:hypothetical protein